MEKRSGPKTEICGTSLLHGTDGEDDWPQRTRCNLPEIYEVIQEGAVPESPKLAHSLDKSISCLIISKAALSEVNREQNSRFALMRRTIYVVQCRPAASGIWADLSLISGLGEHTTLSQTHSRNSDQVSLTRTSSFLSLWFTPLWCKYAINIVIRYYGWKKTFLKRSPVSFTGFLVWWFLGHFFVHFLGFGFLKKSQTWILVFKSVDWFICFACFAEYIISKNMQNLFVLKTEP